MTKAIETSGPGKVYGSTAAVADLDIQVEPGEAYILLGPRGGKDHHHPHASGSAKADLRRASVLGLHPWWDLVEATGGWAIFRATLNSTRA